MELDDLKNAWQQIDSRLKEQEALRIKIIKEMLYAKSEKMLRRLSKYDWFNLFIIILCSPLVLLMFEYYKTTPLQIAIVYIMAGIYALGFFYQIWLVYSISKVDIQKPMSENIKYTLKYKIGVQWGKLCYIIIPFMLVLFFETARIVPIFKVKVSFYIGALVTTLLAGVAYFWFYKVFYKSIDRLIGSLNEIKELEDSEKGD